MNPRLSTKILRPDFQGEFTASILAAAASPDLISFAGGLPNPVSFPVEAMDKATHKVLEKNGVMALQYSGTQGYLHGFAINGFVMIAAGLLGVLLLRPGTERARLMRRSVQTPQLARG